MFVGNIATLRPLFRKFFDSTLRRTGYSSRSRPSRLASNYELSQHGHSKSQDGYMSSTVTEVKGNHQSRRGRRDSQLSDDDSQKLIFDGRGPGAGGVGVGAGTQRTDIMVSRHVNVTYEQ